MTAQTLKLCVNTSTLCILFASVFLAFPTNTFALQTKSASVGVLASIPATGTISLFGYTGPFSKVIAEGPRSYAETLSDKDGYFNFEAIYLSQETKELCIYSVDYQERSTFPNCIPLPPNKQTIGPVLLPPTISISAQIQMSGQTIPQSQVEIVLSNTSRLARSPISAVYAAILPKYTIKTDQNGNYSFNIPDSDRSYRVFSIADSPVGFTPKSQTLSIKITNTWVIYFIVVFSIILGILLALLIKRRFINGKRDRHESPRLLSAEYYSHPL